MANRRLIKIINTAHGKLRVYRNHDNYGALDMKGAKTIKRYWSLMDEQPDSEKHGIFWAFSNSQFKEGVNRMKELGLYKDGQKIYSIGAGGYGISKELIEDFCNFYKERNKKIAKECDPQEVYIYEYNNHECMLDWNDDEAAYKVVVSIFGEETAKGITRFN